MTTAENSRSTGSPSYNNSAQQSPELGSSRFRTADDGSHAAGPTGDYDGSLAQIAARPGATVYPPLATASNNLNPRSCVTCRKRKVRCDKRMPCSNCSRAHTPCVFPPPGRAPRRPRAKETNTTNKTQTSEREVELMKRLRKLEGIVEELSGQVELDAVRHGSSAGQSPENMVDGEPPVPRRSGSTTSGGSLGQGSLAGGLARADSAATSSTRSGPAVQRAEVQPLERTVSADVNKSFGRLVLNDKGRSRYISNEIWSKINDELDHLRSATQTITDEESDASDHETPPGSEVGDDSATLPHQSFIFGYSSANVDLGPLRPLPSQIPFMWQMYQENVDPIVKILHVPTMNKLIREISTNLDRLTPSAEALMFALYYGTVTSMEQEDVKQTLGADKRVLLAQYRFGFEQALAKANLLTDPDVTLCQAFVLFLILVRRQDKSRYTWSLTSLAVRMCQAIGLHRDGTHFPNLSPFEVEMRRRLFWCLAILDVRSAEDQGTEPILITGSFDTKYPTNLNDTDFGPDTVELPKPRDGQTDITFSLMRFEICNTVRQFVAASKTADSSPTTDLLSATLEAREAHLLDVYRQLEHRYLKDNAGQHDPMYWMMVAITRVIVAKMVMVIYQPLLFASPMDQLSCRTRNRLFIAAVEILEYTSLINADPRYKHWCWLFRTYTPYHVIVYVLLEVSGRPWSASVERAWTALNANFSGPTGLSLEKISDQTAVYLPLKKLFYRGKKHRDAEIARLKSDPAAALQLDMDDRACAPLSTFGWGTLPGAATSTTSREKWRNLVNSPPLPLDFDATLSMDCRHRTEYQREPVLMQLPDPPQPQRRCPLLKHEQLAGNTQTASSDPTLKTTITATTTQVQPSLNQSNALGAEALFSNTQFDPSDLFSMPLPTQTQPMERNTVFGYSTADVPRADHTLSGRTTAVPVSTLPPDDNPPLWMWDPIPKAANQAEAVHGIDMDMDMNMDDGLDWQDWQESLRGWMGTGFSGAAGGVWENGI